MIPCTADLNVGLPPAVVEAAEATIADYAAVAEGYANGNLEHDVSQNIRSLLGPLESSATNSDTGGGTGSEPGGVCDLASSFDILDVCSASGRDLVAFTKLGHRAVGLDGVSAFCDMSRKRSGCEVWELVVIRFEIKFKFFVLCIIIQSGNLSEPAAFRESFATRRLRWGIL